MKETYEKLYTYGKSLTQDLQAVQEHLYQALCQADTENRNLQHQMAEMRAASKVKYRGWQICCNRKILLIRLCDKSWTARLQSCNIV